MYNNTFSIDWLHVSEPFQPFALMGSFLYGMPLYSKLSPQAPRFGYTEGMANQAGAVVMRNRNRPDMGVHVGYSGKTLNTYREEGIDNLDMIRWHLNRGAVVSRIDLAFDMRDTDIRPEKCYDLLNAGIAQTTAKAFNLIVGNDGGATCYIGSRQSEAFVRIYDKAAQMGEPGNWIRVELELKASKAQWAAYTMVHAAPDKAFEWAQGWLNGFVSFPIADWRNLMTAEAIPLVRANKPETDTRKWLLEQVAPAMARYMNKTGDYKLLTDFMAILSGLEDKYV